MAKKLELAGKTFGKLKVIKEYGKSKAGQYLWLCKCECGNETIQVGARLKNGDIKSCGSPKCRHHHSIHNETKTRLHRIWSAMKCRCNNPHSANYYLYGGRGIKICDEWQSNYLIFRDWAKKNGYNDDLSIDRINVNGNYEPANCRWATPSEQGYNTRRTKYFEAFGEKHPLSIWAKIYKIDNVTLRNRVIDNKMPLELALTKKVRKCSR